MIRLDDLSFAFDAAHGRVLRDVTVTAAAGRVTAVVGPNAAGKTTLLRCAAGFLAPSSGRAEVDGTDAHRMRAVARAKRLAWVPQRPLVAARFTAREVVALGRYRLPRADDRIDAAIATVDLADVADEPMHVLSAGQQQRVVLARALAQVADDGHLLLDEPTAAMDLKHAARAFAALQAVAAAGATVLIAIHDLAAAARIADDAWVLRGGQLVAAGSVDQTLVPTILEPVFEVDLTDGLQPR